jgi:hypothetical protein
MKNKIVLISIVIVLILTVLISISFLKRCPELKIAQPDLSKGVPALTTDKGELAINLVVETDKKIKDDEYLTLLVRVTGGDVYYISSKPIKGSIHNNSNLRSSFGFVTFGSLNNGDTSYDVIALIAPALYSTTDVYPSIPAGVDCFVMGTFNKSGNIITRTN